jgi:hypothetical protein
MRRTEGSGRNLSQMMFRSREDIDFKPRFPLALLVLDSH